MTELDPEDLSWAEASGARWGATYASPLDPAEDISSALGDDAHLPMNAQAIAHQKRFLGIPQHVELTDSQAKAAAPYLEQLALVVLREVQWAVWWRREKQNRGEPDPGVSYLTLRSEPIFREYLEKVGPGASQVIISDNELARPTFKERRAARRMQKQAGRLLQEQARATAQKLELDRQAQAAEDARQKSEQARRAMERLRNEQDEIRRRRPNAPSPQPFGVSHQGAERLAAEWMRHLGVRDAVVTKYSGDGGIDVESPHVVAQVKNIHPASSVPIAQIRDLHGTATHRGKGAVLFTSGRVSAAGETFADETGIALIRYEAEKGTISGLNRKGRKVIFSGFPVVFNFDEF